MIKKNKKGDISIGIIIIAAVGILVLIVLVIVFSGKTKVFSTQGARCETNGGICTTVKCGTGEAANYPKQSYTYGCAKDTTTTNVQSAKISSKHCCIPTYDPNLDFQ